MSYEERVKMFQDAYMSHVVAAWLYTEARLDRIDSLHPTYAHDVVLQCGYVYE